MRLSRWERYKRNIKNTFSSGLHWSTVMQVSFMCLVLGFIIFVVIGMFTQRENVTVFVTGKYVSTSQSTECDTVTNPDGTTSETNCYTYTSRSYTVVATGESFSATEILYYQVKENKTHVFHVIGWKYFRYITQILEVGK